MDKITLKRGRGVVSLEKSEDLIAIRPSPSAHIQDVLASSSRLAPQDDTGITLGAFRLLKVGDSTESMENTLDQLRQHHLVDAGSHVYHTSQHQAPYVPTGQITLRFMPSSTSDQRQEVLDRYALEILEVRRPELPSDEAAETLIVRTTPGSPNPLKVAHQLQQETEVVLLAEPDLATPARSFAIQLPSDSLLKDQWHLRNTGIQSGSTTGLKAGADARVVDAWKRAKSLGSAKCIVAVIDDGFDLKHPDLSGGNKVVAPWDFTTNTDDPSPRAFHPDVRFAEWHGTACAGVAVGRANGSGIVGAAPDCRLMPVRWGPYLSDDQIESWFAHVANHGASVVSCSWGAADPYYVLSQRQEEAIARCATKGRGGLGCVIVFAAGNDNHDINNPAGGTLDGFAIHPDVIAVAASNSMDRKSSYSNYGNEISVCAPSSGAGGRGILTSDVTGRFVYGGVSYDAGYSAGDFTWTFGGTSSAAPLVAGICALVLSVNPKLSAKGVKKLIEKTARRMGDMQSYTGNGHSVYHGYGCVNADAAVQQVLGTAPNLGGASMTEEMPSASWMSFLQAYAEARTDTGESTTVQGFLDIEHSTQDVAMFSVRPCDGEWIPIPTEVILYVKKIGDVDCGEQIHPEVLMRLSRQTPIEDALVSVLQLSQPLHTRYGRPKLGGSGAGYSPGLPATYPPIKPATGTKDIRLEVKPINSIYSWSAYIAGEEVEGWNPEGSLWWVELPNYPGKSLDAELYVKGVNGARAQLTIKVDGAALKPVLQAVVAGGSGSAKHSYAIQQDQ